MLSWKTTNKLQYKKTVEEKNNKKKVPDVGFPSV